MLKPRQSRHIPGRWRQLMGNGRAAELGALGTSRRRVLSRLARGAAIGVLGADALGVGYLMTTAVMKMLSSQAARKSALPALNTAQIITDPRTKLEGLLINLPNGTLVAYDRACTHAKVYVDYDPKTHLLVCPAHQAIFDPAHAGRVVQGPATVPLPQLSVKVRSDGSLQIS